MTLFDHTYPTQPGWKEPDTSKQAAESVASRVHLLRNRCLTQLRLGSLTADECAAALGESVLSIRPRFSELVQLGKIADSGERRPNASQRSAKVWRII